MLKRGFFASRPLTACALLLAAGIYAGIRMPFQPLLAAAGLVLCILWAAAERRRGADLVAAAAGCFLFFGMLYGGLASHPAVPESRGTGVIEAVVAQPLAPRSAGGYRSVLKDAVFTDAQGHQEKVGRLYWTMNPRQEDEAQMAFVSSLQAGDRVTVSGKLYQPSAQVNPYGFDFRMYCLQQGIRLGFSGCTDGVITERNVFSPEGLAVSLRKSLSSAMDRIFGTSAAYPKALLLGERDALDEDTRENFSDLGIAHILAVSGLHVALLAGVVLAAARRCGAGVRVRLVTSLVFLTLYCAILGFPVSAVRASVLFCLEQARRVRRRSGDALTSLSAAMILVLLLFPLSLMSVSFYMSFGAVLGIHLVHNTLDRYVVSWRPRALVSSALTTLGATAGMVLPSVAAYHTFSLWGLLLSPLACAFLALLLPAYLVIFLAGLAWLPLGQMLSGVLEKAVGWIPATLSGLKGMQLVLPSPSVLFVIAFLTVLLLLTRYVLLSPRRRLITGAAVAALCLLISLAGQDRSVRYIQFSAGQADAALIEDGDKTLVIDTGENGSDMASYLLSRGRRVDTLILTHLHSDHCGGTFQLLDAGLIPGEVILPEGAERQALDPMAGELLQAFEAMQIPVRHVGRWDEIVSDTVRLTVLWPEKGKVRSGQDANLYSLAMLADFGGANMLLTGDLDGTFEAYAAVPADILKVAHHGSGASTNREFLEKVHPEALIMTCESGRALPNINTLALLEEYGAPVYRTDRTGAVTIRFYKNAYTITPYLK